MSSVHDGVSCDTCMKNNFSGKRYKCLVCYDFDLCSNCYDNGATNSQHLNTHPMQCILTRADYDLYYGGDQQAAEPHSFTCPYCGLLGFNEQTLCEHIGIEHEDDSYEVVCPICAAIPSGDPNHLTEDLLNHISLEHRSNITNNNHRDSNSTTASTTATTTTTTGTANNTNNSGGDDTNLSRFSRRLNSRTTTTSRRGCSRNTFQYANSGTLSALVSSTGMDPIAELLSQLSGVRRAAQSAQNSQLQLQQLQAQLSREREHLQQTRHLFGKVTSTGSTTTTNATSKTNGGNQNQQQTTTTTNANSIQSNSWTNQILELPTIFQSTNMSRDNRYLLSKYDNSSYTSNNDDEQQQQQQQQKPQTHHHHHHHHHHSHSHHSHSTNNNNNNQTINQMNQSFFIQDILLSTLMKQLDNNNIESNKITTTTTTTTTALLSPQIPLTSEPAPIATTK